MPVKDYKLPRPVVGWIHNHARNNYWRVANWYGIEDLIHDGLMIAYNCQERYGIPGKTIDEPHFMSLVKTSFYNHIGDLLRKNRGVTDGPKLADMAINTESEADVLDRITPGEQPAAEFNILINELPEYLRKAVLLYFDDEMAVKLRRRLRVRLKGGDETFSERLSRLCGFPPDKDFEQELLCYLWERSANADIQAGIIPDPIKVERALTVEFVRGLIEGQVEFIKGLIDQLQEYSFEVSQ